ncbi:hypothetical protein TNCT_400181 [Trichonephila clavata]|uniref:Uncharacterized protein n=1 Tax=Trichonephila clavata TaxID=2740835 RepID=A0A8X6LBM8_TRICU|nr:hypothetical protein TNCT_400181 [Trichonephila clavata]
MVKWEDTWVVQNSAQLPHHANFRNLSFVTGLSSISSSTYRIFRGTRIRTHESTEAIPAIVASSLPCSLDYRCHEYIAKVATENLFNAVTMYDFNKMFSGYRCVH